MADPTLPGNPSDDDGQRVRQLGMSVISRLHGVLRGMRLYDAGNRALRTQQQELLDALQAIGSDEVSLLGMGEYFYLNGVRLRPEESQLPVFRSLLRELESRRLGGLRFSAGATLQELESFLRVLHAEQGPTAAAALEEMAVKAGVRNICAIRARAAGAAVAEESGAPATDQELHRAKLVFRRALHGTRELIVRTGRTGRPALQQARRVVQSVVDQLQRERGSLIGLTALKRHDEYAYAHYLHVSILAVGTGQALGLARAELAGLGVAALLHDLGKLVVPSEVLGKGSALDDAEWAALRRHPLEGLRIVSRMPGTSELMLDAMRTAFEHHMELDHSGYPQVLRPRELAAFTRIVAAADFYDAVTSHRAGQGRALTGHEALRLMLGRERERFDDAVLWALARTIGLYPAGSLLRAQSGRRFLSMGPGPDDPRRPVCRELGETEDGALVPGAELVLDGQERIEAVLSPGDVGADVQALLAA